MRNQNTSYYINYKTAFIILFFYIYKTRFYTVAQTDPELTVAQVCLKLKLFCLHVQGAELPGVSCCAWLFFVSVSFSFLQAVLVLPVEVSFVYMLNHKCFVPSYTSPQ